MPPDQDDNPFGRASAWPKMPQGPFKVGIPVKPLAAGETPETLPQARQITPVFTRPAEADGLSLLTRPSPLMATPRTQPAPRPQPAPEPAAAPEPPPMTAPPVAAPPPQPAPLGIELEPLIVEAPGRRRAAPQRRRSAWPALIAGGVGLAAVGALVLAFNRAGEHAAAPAPVVPPTVTTTPALASTSPRPPAEAATTPPPGASAAPRSVAIQSRAPSPRRARQGDPLPPTVTIEPPPAPAAPPALEVAPPPATEAAPSPQPAFQRPPPPDPNAPVTTQRPY